MRLLRPAIWCLRVAAIALFLHASLPVGASGGIEGSGVEETPPRKAQAGAPSMDMDSGWKSFRGGTQLRGYRQGEISTRPKLRWTFETNAGVESTAVIDSGRVFVGTTKGLVALELRPKMADGSIQVDGKELWRVPSEAGMRSSPGLKEGRLFFGDDFGAFHAINAEDGKEVWSFQTESESEIISSANFFDDKVLFGSYDGYVYCFTRQDGKLAWKYLTDGYVHASLAVAEGRTFVAGCDEYLRGVALKDGSEMWSLPLGSNCAASPVISGDRLFVGTYGGEILAIDWKRAVGDDGVSGDEAAPEGAVQADVGPADVGAEAPAIPLAWKYADSKSRFPFYASAAVGRLPASVGTREVVVAGGRDKAVHAIDAATGKRLWKFRTKGRVDASPVIVGGYVFAASLDSRLYLLDLASGSKVWEFTADSRLHASPAVGEGVVVISSADGLVYCFDLRG